MCGRYKLDLPQIAFKFIEADAPSASLQSRYNIKPTQRVYVSRALKTIEEMQWGIKPPWGTASNILINAKSETVREKRSFKKSFTERRCLMVADGFFEWLTEGKVKTPFLFTLKDRAPFAIGAFYDAPATEEDANRCCLLTTTPNEILQPIHDRMPVIIRKEDWQEWFAPGDLSESTFKRITAPYDASSMNPALELSRFINTAKEDSARCIDPAPPMPTRPKAATPPPQQELF